ncbi:hypothetical protein AAHH67_23005 [Niallia circulans]
MTDGKTETYSKNIYASFLLIGVVISIGPFYWMLVGATNPSGDVLAFPPKLIPGDYLLENLRNLSNSIDIVKAVTNSSIIAIVFVVVSLFICSAAGYAFAKFKFKGAI